MLRRETAIELPITPSKLQKVSEQNQEFQISNERRAISADNPPRISPTTPPRHNNNNNNNTMNYLIPESSDQRFHSKKSNESLHKNSSSDNTDYSAHPYHVIKQNSNDTNSSFNIDNSSFTNDISLCEAETTNTSTTLNSTVIENTVATELFPKRASTISAIDAARPSCLLRKQFSIDQSGKRPVSENLERTFAAENINRSTSVVPSLNAPSITSKISPRIQMNVLKESCSSTSTDDAKDDLMRRKMIPSISTHLVQDEIAKLSLNIKSSTEEDVDDDVVVGVDDENVETMC